MIRPRDQGPGATGPMSTGAAARAANGRVSVGDEPPGRSRTARPRKDDGPDRGRPRPSGRIASMSPMPRRSRHGWRSRRRNDNGPVPKSEENDRAKSEAGRSWPRPSKPEPKSRDRAADHVGTNPRPGCQGGHRDRPRSDKRSFVRGFGRENSTVGRLLAVRKIMLHPALGSLSSVA